jgi:hypothetical protein
MGIETAVLVGTLASAAVGTGSALMQANQASNMADYQTKQSAADAQTAASQAQVQARQIRLATDRTRSQARAAQATSGVVSGVGTGEQIDQTIDSRGEQDALSAIYQGNTRATQIQTAGNLAAAQSNNAGTASLINGATTALSGFATAAKGWNLSKKAA